jgi:hypothetical protein
MTDPHAFIRQYLAIENKRTTLKNQARVVDFCNFTFIHIFRTNGGTGNVYRQAMQRATNDYLAALNKKAALFTAIFRH